MSQWRIHYADGSTFSDEDGAPEDAPIDGVQVIVLAQEGGNEVVMGHDTYLWIGDRWSGGSHADLERWIRAGYVRPGLVKFGLILSNDEYRQRVAEATQ